MSSEYKLSPVFQAVEVYFSGKDVVFVCPTETEAQRVFYDAQLNGLGDNVALDRNKFIILGFFGRKSRKEAPATQDELS